MARVGSRAAVGDAQQDVRHRVPRAMWIVLARARVLRVEAGKPRLAWRIAAWAAALILAAAPWAYEYSQRSRNGNAGDRCSRGGFRRGSLTLKQAVEQQPHLPHFARWSISGSSMSAMFTQKARCT